MILEEFIKTVRPYSMTSVERITELFNSLEYIRINKIPGDIVECGVWKGGNIKGIMDYLHYHDIQDKKVWLYDTFEGMTEPDENDVDLRSNKAKDILESVMCYASLDSVKSLLQTSKFSQDQVNYVIGDILKTLTDVNNVPDKISLLRLDTDWYQSTKIELDVLYPNLSVNGVLIVDDYGHWQGSKKAVDEYFSNSDIEIHKIDYTGIKLIKNK
jgi:hypothetical protein